MRTAEGRSNMRLEKAYQHDEKIGNLYSSPNFVVVVVSRMRYGRDNMHIGDEYTNSFSR
jgi:hypothetical protein